MAASFDVTEVDRLLTDLGKVDDVLKEGRQSVSKGALNIRRNWRRRWGGHPHIPALPSAVTYDLAEFGYRVEAEIGPDKDRPQGPLGNIIEFGTSKNAPIPGGLPSLDAEAPRFEKAIEKIGEDLLPK